ncbi:HEAT repeat domain-containing protein [Planctomycetales bacterium ZRK34]|nr:HEAT repeat domain-containing protein [Planctomycetales bacterium ZRK34]
MNLFNVPSLKFKTAAALLTLGATVLAGPMDDEQLYTLPQRTQTIDPRLEPLMSEALKQPDQLTRLQAMTEVRKYQFTGLTDRVVELLDAPEPLIVTTALQTLDVLDDRKAAERLIPFVAPKEGYDQAAMDQTQIADRVLARWKSPAAVELWVKRLPEASAPLSLRISAAEALGVCKADADKVLTSIIADANMPLTLRLAAAKSLGQIVVGEPGRMPTDLVDRLVAGRDTIGPLLAVRIVQHARNPLAIEFLHRLAGHSEPAVQYTAMAELFNIDPSNLWPAAAQTLGSIDPKVRLVTVRSLKTRLDPDSVKLLAPLLNDPHPQVRTAAHESLLALAKDNALNPLIRAAMVDIIKQAVDEQAQDPAPHWRAAEQAAILIGELGEKSAADMLVDLFDHTRLEVRVAAVIGLRPLKVPSTRQPMVKLTKTLIDRMEWRIKDHAENGDEGDSAALMKIVDANAADSKQAAEAAQTLGVWRVKAADKVLRRFIPKDSPASPRARASAIWALGWIHENSNDTKLGDTLIKRVFDLNPLNPEADEVRKASILTIARMKVVEQTDALKNRYRLDGLDIQYAARWAIHHMTGELLDEITLQPGMRRDAFISPVD